MSKSNLNIRQFLDLSTWHIRESSVSWLNDNATANSEYGWWLYAPDCNEEDLRELWPNCPNEIINICQKARQLNCDYINIDRDALEMDDLPTWDW